MNERQIGLKIEKIIKDFNFGSDTMHVDQENEMRHDYWGYVPKTKRKSKEQIDYEENLSPEVKKRNAEENARWNSDPEEEVKEIKNIPLMDKEALEKRARKIARGGVMVVSKGSGSSAMMGVGTSKGVQIYVSDKEPAVPFYPKKSVPYAMVFSPPTSEPEGEASGSVVAAPVVPTNNVPMTLMVSPAGGNVEGVAKQAAGETTDDEGGAVLMDQVPIAQTNAPPVEYVDDTESDELV